MTTLTRPVVDLVNVQDAPEIAVEAYVYLFPLVNMDVARRQMTNIEAGVRDAFGPSNAFHHIRAFTPPDEKIIARPNFDTLYSNAWLDLVRWGRIGKHPVRQDRLPNDLRTRRREPGRGGGVETEALPHPRERESTTPL